MQHTPKKGLSLLICGMMMGAADLVPGISGGTIAFIMGFYAQLINALKTITPSNLKLLLKGDWKAFNKSTDWKFLTVLFLGILLSFAGLSTTIHRILSSEEGRTLLYSSFLGLIVASSWFCLKEVKKWTRLTTGCLVAGVIGGYCLTTMPALKETGDFAIQKLIDTHGQKTQNYSAKQQLLTGLNAQELSVLLAKGILDAKSPIYSDQGKFLGVAADYASTLTGETIDLWLILSGAAAVSAMLLPGISGSYVFNLLGVYPLIIEAMANFFESLQRGILDWPSIEILFNVGLGIIVGGLLFARLISWLLKMYETVSMALLSGFMWGALPSVWPFWSYTWMVNPLNLEKGPQLIPMEKIIPSWGPDLALAGLSLCLGFFAVIVIQFLGKKSRDLQPK